MFRVLFLVSESCFSIKTTIYINAMRALYVIWDSPASCPPKSFSMVLGQQTTNAARKESGLNVEGGRYRKGEHLRTADCARSCEYFLLIFLFCTNTILFD